jgi:hypothetical protein
MFPKDILTKTIDTHATPKSALFLSAVDYDRTALYSTINCNSTGDYSIVFGSDVTQPNINNLITTEQTQNLAVFLNTKIPAYTELYYSKPATTDKCTFRLMYTDYDYSISTTTINTNAGISTINGFTYGEVILVLVLIMIFTITFFAELKQWIFGVRIENPMKNKYNKDL